MNQHSLTIYGIKTQVRADKEINGILIGRFGLVLVVLLCLISGAHVYKQWNASPRTLKWDNAMHAVSAAEIAQDIRRADIKAFLRDTNKQVFHPFVQSYIWGIFFVILGISDKSAVLCGLVLFLGAMAVLYKICITIDRDKGWIAGLIGCATMMCIPINLAYQAQVMIETPCLLIGLSSVYFYIKSFDSDDAFYPFIAGMFLALLFFTKYNYGFLFTVIFVFWERIHGRQIYNGATRVESVVPCSTSAYKRILVLIFPLISSLLIWFSANSMAKIHGLLGFAFSRTSCFKLVSSENLLLYPRMILRDYFPDSILFCAFILIFAILLINFKKMNSKLKFITFLFVLSYLSIIIHPNKDSRLLLPVFPLFVITGLLGICSLSINKVFMRVLPAKITSYLLFGSIIVLLLLDISKIYSVFLPSMLADYYGNEKEKQVLAYTTDKIIGSNMKNVFFTGTFNELNGNLFLWDLYTKNLSDRKYISLEEIPYPGKFNRAGLDYELNEKYARVFYEWLKNRKFNYAVTIELYDYKSSYYNYDYINFCRWKLNYVTMFKYQDMYNLIEEKKFKDKGLVIRFYKKA